MGFTWAILFWLLKSVAAQDANCDFYQKLTPTSVVSILSPRWPSNYTGQLQCRWIAECPTGYNCRMDCPEINLPQSASCTVDKLLVSKSGDDQLIGADTYCGRGSLSVTSTGPRLSVALLTSANTPGGRFRCDVSARLSTPNTQCTCGYTRQNRIVGGQETGVNEFPMMVGLADRRISQIKCGGVILSQKFVLTAAHCVYNLNTTDLVVIVGEHNVTTGSETTATKGFRIARFIIHPLFTDATYDYDIAIIEVDGTIAFNDRVGPACLPFKFANKSFTGDLVTLLGWGTQFFAGPVSNVLMKTNVEVISQSQCQSTEPNVTSRQMCTYTPGKDGCQDDSGGPAMYPDSSNGLFHVVGIMSTGRACASGFPGVNTRVTAFLDWIVASTRELYCVK